MFKKLSHRCLSVYLVAQLRVRRSGGSQSSRVAAVCSRSCTLLSSTVPLDQYRGCGRGSRRRTSGRFVPSGVLYFGMALLLMPTRSRSRCCSLYRCRHCCRLFRVVLSARCILRHRRQRWVTKTRLRDRYSTSQFCRFRASG